MIKKIHTCDRINFTSNANEVIRAVLNSLFIYFFFLQKDFTCTSTSAKTQPSKSIKAQRRNQAKAQKRK